MTMGHDARLPILPFVCAPSCLDHMVYLPISYIYSLFRGVLLVALLTSPG